MAAAAARHGGFAERCKLLPNHCTVRGTLAVRLIVMRRLRWISCYLARGASRQSCGATIAASVRTARDSHVHRVTAASSAGRRPGHSADRLQASDAVHRFAGRAPRSTALPAISIRPSQWCAYFGVDPAAHADWHVRGILMQSRQRFEPAGLLPADLPDFASGYARGDEFWLYDQTSPYYRRHLLLHEGTHAFMYTLLGGVGPPWYAEGMAELLATHRLADGQLTLNSFRAAATRFRSGAASRSCRTDYADRRGDDAGARSLPSTRTPRAKTSRTAGAGRRRPFSMAIRATRRAFASLPGTCGEPDFNGPLSTRVCRRLAARSTKIGNCSWPISTTATILRMEIELRGRQAAGRRRARRSSGRRSRLAILRRALEAGKKYRSAPAAAIRSPPSPPCGGASRAA